MYYILFILIMLVYQFLRGSGRRQTMQALILAIRAGGVRLHATTCQCMHALSEADTIAGADPGGGGALGAEAPPFIFNLYLINMLSIIMKFCLSIII